MNTTIREMDQGCFLRGVHHASNCEVTYMRLVSFVREANCDNRQVWFLGRDMEPFYWAILVTHPTLRVRYLCGVNTGASRRLSKGELSDYLMKVGVNLRRDCFVDTGFDGTILQAIEGAIRYKLGRGLSVQDRDRRFCLLSASKKSIYRSLDATRAIILDIEHSPKLECPSILRRAKDSYALEPYTAKRRRSHPARHYLSGFISQLLNNGLEEV